MAPETKDASADGIGRTVFQDKKGVVLHHLRGSLFVLNQQTQGMPVYCPNAHLT